MTVPFPRHQNFSCDEKGWAHFLPARSASSPLAPLTGNLRYSYAVIGAGFTGLACARQLAILHPQDEILLVDARLVAQGASGRNSGFAVAHSQITGAYDEAQHSEYLRIDRINNAGMQLLRGLVATHNIQCQWEETGFFHTAADKLSLVQRERFLRYLDKMQIAHTPLDSTDLSQRLGTNHYQCGVHVSAGVTLQPASLARTLADNLPDNVVLHEQSPVMKILPGAPVTLIFEKADVSVDKLILATNYETARLGFLRRYLTATTLTGSVTRILTPTERASLGSASSWGVLSLHPGGATVRLTADNRILIRNTAEYYGGILLPNSRLAKRQKIHRDAFEMRFPQLSHVPFEHTWSGVEGISANGTSFFGELKKNIFAACIYNGSGITRGTAFGHALAHYASNADCDLIGDCLAYPKAKWLPPRPLLDIGAHFTRRNRFRGVGKDR